MPTLQNYIHVERGDKLKKDSLKKTVPKKRGPPPAKVRRNKMAAIGKGTGDSSVGVGGAHCIDGEKGGEMNTNMTYNQMMGFNLMVQFSPPVGFCCYFCQNLDINFKQSFYDPSIGPNRTLYYSRGSI